MFQSVSPGSVKTEFAQAGGYHQTNTGVLQNIPVLDPKDIADAILHVLSARDRVQVRQLITIL